MSPRMRRTAALAGGAAVLAFGAYTVGSQAGDGVAQSQGGPGGGAFVAYGGGPGGPPPGGPPPGPPGPRGAGLSDLAKKLGVKQADLQKALDKLRGSQRPPNPGDRRDDLAAKLADKLKVDKADVQKALDEIRKEEEAEHEKRRNEFAAALAKELGISADKVKDALPARPPHHGRRGP
jgi:DNA-binding MarR family transcriptional regulator